MLCFFQSRLLAQDTVTVYARLHTELQSSLPVQTLKDSALSRLNSLSVADAIRYFAGVQLKDYGGIGGLKTVDVRNMGANHTGLLYNGIPISNMQNGQVDLGKFSLENIEQVSLYSGGVTEILQPASAYATAATIYLRTKYPTWNTGQHTQFSISFKTGSFGLWNPAVLWQQKLSEKDVFQFSAEHLQANGRYTFRKKVLNAFDTTAIRKNADISAWRLENTWWHYFNDSATLQTQIYYYNSDRGLPGAIVSNRFDNPQRLWDRNLFLQSQYKKTISPVYSFSLMGKYAYDYTHYQDPNTVGVDGTLNNYYHAQQIFVSAANAFHISSRWTGMLSGDYKYEYLRANLDNFAYPKRNSWLVFAGTQYQHSSRLNASANILGTFITNNVKTGEAAHNVTKYTPAFSVSYQPFASSAFRIRGFYKNIFRMPTFNDLYYTSIGTVSLQPELTHQWNVGASYLIPLHPNSSFISIQTDGFYHRVKDKIIAMPSQNLFRWRMVNLDKVQTWGIASTVKSEMHWFQNFITAILLQYTYENSKNITAGNAYGFPVPYTPRHSGSAVINISYKKWHLDYSYLYTGSRYNVTDISLPYSKLEPWYTHDASIGYAWHWRQRKLQTTVGINNLWNQQYEVIANYPMPGRNIRITIHYNF